MDPISIFKNLKKTNKKLKNKFKHKKKSRISKNNTLFIFDWDDTLYPTSYVNKRENNINLSLLDKKIFQLLNNLESYGKIAIVSNASLSWIKHSTKKIPKTKKFLQSSGTIIFSAQDKYKKKYSLQEWKKYAFRHIVKKHMKSFVVNVFSIGDSKHEYHSLMSLPYANYINNKNRIIYLKSIKLLDNPKYNRIIKQLEYLKDDIPKYTKTEENLDIFY
jgi:hypothetical protein